MTPSSAQSREATPNTWWITLLEGIAVLLLGAFILMTPAPTIAAVTVFLGVYLLVTGIFLVVRAFVREKDHRVRFIVLGGLSAAVGLIILANPLFSSQVIGNMIVYLIALAAVGNGIVLIFAGGREEADEKRHRSLGYFLLGLISIVIGIIVVATQFVAASFILWTLGILAILGGLGLIVTAFMQRNAPG